MGYPVPSDRSVAPYLPMKNLATKDLATKNRAALAFSIPLFTATYPMSQLERLILMAEDELTEYSTQARKIEKLRRKIGLSVSPAEQQEVRQALQDMVPDRGILKAIEENRQNFALPLWGITGLGLLEGFLGIPWGWLAAIAGTAGAFSVQRLGWQLQAKRLLIETFDDIEARTADLKRPERS